MNRHQVETLGRYNSEVQRGIVHTEEWKEKMRVLQAAFNTKRTPSTWNPVPLSK